jgi:hypothetical protein
MILRSPAENENEYILQPRILRRVRRSRMLLTGIQGNPDWTPDPFDVAQGRGEYSRTTIKTFGVTIFGVASLYPSRNFRRR